MARKLRIRWFGAIFSRWSVAIRAKRYSGTATIGRGVFMLRAAILFVSILALHADSLEQVRKTIEVVADAKGVFITTNRSSAPFYLISSNIDFTALVGTKPDTNVFSASKIALTSQYVPALKMVNGRIVGPDGYYMVSGRYAYRKHRTLTLTDFQMSVGDTAEKRGEILSASVQSVIVPIDTELEAEWEKAGSH